MYMSTLALILIVTTSVNLGLLGIMLSKRPKGTPSTPLLHFSLGIIFLLLWSGANYFADTSSISGEALFWTRMTFVPGLLACLFILFFSKLFPLSREVFPKGWIANSLLVVAACVVVFTEFGIRAVTVSPGIGITGIELGAAYGFVVLVLFYLMAKATYTFFKQYKSLTGNLKQQVLYVLIGWGLFLAFAFFTNALLPLLTNDASWSKYGPLGSVVMVSAITYAIVRHALFDIKIIIQRGLIYSILLFLSALLYTALLFGIEQLFSRGIEVDAVIGAFITAIVAIIGAAPLEKFFKRITNPIFFKHQYDYAGVLADLADILNKNLSERVIIKLSSAVITSALHPQEFIFSIKPVANINKENIILTIPIKNKEKQIGQIYLGKKRSGDAYGKDDISLLTTFASQAGVALEKARLYEEVKNQARTLEKKVEERTAEIVELHKEQEEMMHEISHGLQTPLTIMKGELYFLRKQGYESGKIDVIDDSINRISTFINKLLGLYRLETTKKVKVKTVELRDLLMKVGDGLGGLMQERNIAYEILAPKAVKIKGDLDGLEEVFSNLIHNAIKYAKPIGETKILISLESDKDKVTVSVTDTGIGIPKNELNKLFTKFYRVRGESTRHVSGTGLGLVITKKIVERHGGTIKVESEFGSGTTFIVTLPK